MEGSGFGVLADFEKWIEEKYKNSPELWDDFKGNTLDGKKYYYKQKRKYLKEKYNKKTYLYLTLSPDKYLRNIDVTPENIANMKKWADTWFEYNPKYYGDYKWVIEGGSDNTHLHLHAVAEMKSSHKHAERLKCSWKKYFPNNQLLTTLNLQNKNGKRGEYCYLSFDSPEILKDKLAYFNNETKNLHENLVDLKVSGSRGF